MQEPIHDFDEIADPAEAPQAHLATAGEDDLPEASAGQLADEDAPAAPADATGTDAEPTEAAE